jgi:beta-lactam-binding protein with PASTA domain
MILAGLAGLAVLLLLFRLVTGGGEDDPRRGDGRAARAEVPDLRGAEFIDAQAVLGDAGFRVKVVPVESDEEPGIVVAMKPRPGSRVKASSTVTLSISAEREDEGNDGPSEPGDTSGPGNGNGKGKGKAKGHDKKKGKKK